MARNSIILNGKSSDTITGLIIQELPPISKPLMRSQVEEIDGRDGDIITKLGFSAYDKEISVGLYGNFDINEIIAYFNSEGTVTFSNEPDKFYYYQILEQIDFERLVRFRTATVKFHVQPFKYSTTEEPETIDGGGTVSAEGTSLTLENTGDKPFRKLDLKGDAFQDTAPTPNSPQYVQIVSGEQNIQICGRNLAWDGWAEDFAARMQESGHEAGIGTGGPDDRDVIFYFQDMDTDEYDDEYLDYLFKTSFEENTQYTVSFDIYSDEYTHYCNLAWAYTDGTFESFGQVPTTQDQWEHIVVTSAAGKTVKYIRIGTPTLHPSGTRLVALDTFMIEKGTTASDYEPYQGQSYDIDLEKDTSVQIDLGSIELCKIGTYQDYIYKTNGNWYIHSVIGKAILTGDANESWAFQSGDHQRFTHIIDDIKLATDQTDKVPLVCDHFTTTTVASIYNGQNYAIASHYGSHQIWVSYFTYTSSNDFKTWLSTHNTTVYYPLATPTDTAITDETLIGQLEALWALNGYDDQTILGVTATGSNLAAIPSGQTLKGDTFQQTYSGKNLFDLDDLANVSSTTYTADGWATVDVDNSEGSSAVYANFTPGNLPNTLLPTSTVCSVVAEIKSVSVTGGSASLSLVNTHAQSQFTTTVSVSLADLTDGQVYVGTSTTKSDYTGCSRSTRTFVGVSAGTKATITYRMSLVVGTNVTPQNFVYEPWTGGTPSPNPDYPQDIQVVTGVQTVQIERSIELSGLVQGTIMTDRDIFFKNTPDSEYYNSALVENMWYKKTAIGKIVLNGSETWSTISWSGLSNDLLAVNTGAIDSLSRIGALAGLSDHFKLLTLEELYANNIGFYINVGAGVSPKKLWFVINKSALATADTAGWKAWLAANPTTVYYVLRTPIYAEVSDQSLFTQLEALKNNATTYKGRTHILSTSKDNTFIPHVVAVEALESGSTIITNEGNTYSKPKITIYGSGDIGLYLDDVEILQIALGDEEYITIDAAQMEAYKDTLDNLKNRLVTGSYTNFALKPGANEISFSGQVEKYIVENYSRWL